MPSENISADESIIAFESITFADDFETMSSSGEESNRLPLVRYYCLAKDVQIGMRIRMYVPLDIVDHLFHCFTAAEISLEIWKH